MNLQEAIDFWTRSSPDDARVDQPLLIDAESIPGWVIALRCPRDQTPYIELWWESDFIEETRAHQAATSKVSELS